MQLPRWIHQRIRRKTQVYLVPTTEGLWWLGTIGLLMIMGWGYTNNLCLALGMILAAMTVVLLMEAHFNLEGLKLDKLIVEDQFLGRSSVVRYWWKSKKKRARHKIILSWDGQGPVGAPHSNAATNNGETITSWFFPERGLWQQTHVILSSRYPLGLFKAWSYHPQSVEAWVYPKPIAGRPSKKEGAEGVGEARLVEAASGDEPGDVRRYQDGDSPTRVAWKVMARGLGAHTKTFLSETQEIHDYRWPWGAGDEEARSKLAYAIESHHLAHESWGLTVHQNELGFHFGRQHQQNCLRALTVAT